MHPFDGTIPAPTVVSVESTRYCNLRCPMCEFVDLGTVATGPHMPLDEFTRIVTGLPAEVERVQLTVTGEPLLTRDLDKMIEVVAAHGLRLDVLTNGMLLTGKVVDQLLPVLGRLQVSFDGATKATFEAIRVRSDFARVCRNVRAFVARVRELPAAERPQVGLECTIMRSNIEELPALVELAADLGVHRLACHHVHPFVERLRAESLANHVELAERCIDAALARAKALGLPMSVEALGTVIADTAKDDGEQRVVRRDTTAAADPNRLPARSVGFEHCPPVPASRRAASAPASTDAELPATIGYCQYLWERAEIAIDGDVRACCVAGAPYLGNVRRDPFARIWNGPVYRAMRAGIVAQQPVAFCKGCQYLRVETDPQRIRAHLGGRALPTTIPDLQPVAWGSPTLAHAAVVAHHGAPTLHWPAADGAEGYDVQFSADQFAKIEFSTAWHGLGVPAGPNPAFVVPDWVWAKAPPGVPFHWRAIGWIGGNCVELAVGALLRTA
jgi:MoaA/NifB/PqqE/SkfB family radical SAM enzyme